MERIVPTFIAAGVTLMLMFRGLATEQSAATSNNANSTALGVVDAVTMNFSNVLALMTPQVMLIVLLAGVAFAFMVVSR